MVVFKQLFALSAVAVYVLEREGVGDRGAERASGGALNGMIKDS